MADPKQGVMGKNSRQSSGNAVFAIVPWKPTLERKECERSLRFKTFRVWIARPKLLSTGTNPD